LHRATGVSGKGLSILVLNYAFKKSLMTIVLRFEASYLPEYFYDIHNVSDCNISLISQNASTLEVVHISQDFEGFGLNV